MSLKTLLKLMGCLVALSFVHVLFLQAKTNMYTKPTAPLAPLPFRQRTPWLEELSQTENSTTRKWNVVGTSSLSLRRLQRLEELRLHSGIRKLQKLNRTKSKPASQVTSVSKASDACTEIGNFPAAVSSTPWRKFKTLLENYTEFHKEGIERLRRGDRSVRTLTWSCFDWKTCCGIGDQISHITQVFLLAMMSRRVFTIYWDETSLKTMHYLQPNNIDWTYFNQDGGMHIVHDEEMKSLEHNNGYHRLYALLMGQERKHLTMNHELGVPIGKGFSRMLSRCKNISKEMDRIGIGGALNQVESVLVLGEILRYLFRFSEEVIEVVNNVQRFLGIYGQPYLAVHIRTGFLGTKYEEKRKNKHFSKNMKMYRNTDDWEAALNCSIRKAITLLGPSALVFLATDSYLVKELAADERYSTRIRQIKNITLQHVAFLEPSGDHHNADITLGEIDGYMGTWVDFLLLARSSILVHSISVFSSLAGQYCSVSQRYYPPRCTKSPK